MCTHQFSIGGLSNVIHKLLKEFSRAGHNVDVMAPSTSDTYGIISVNCLNLPGLLGTISFWENSRKKINRIYDDYDIIFLHHPVLISTRFPEDHKNIIITFHGTYHGYGTAYKSYNLGSLAYYYDLASLLERRLLYSLSEQKHIRLTWGGAPSSIVELNANGYLGEPYFIPSALPKNTKRIPKKRARHILSESSKIQVDSDDRVILFVGSAKNVASKRPLHVYSLFNKLKKTNSCLKLIMVGGGISSSLLDSLADNDDHFFNMGYVEPNLLYLFYSCADAYISLSCYEGLPNSVLEAASYKLPLILSNIAAHNWIISSKIGQGILINSFDPLNDITKIMKFLNSIPDVVTIENSTYFTKYNGWDLIAKEYLKLLLVE